MAIKAGIVGGTGYTGVELLRLLAMHEGVSLEVITSRGDAGTRVDEMFPSLRGHCDLVFSEPDAKALANCDVVFFATPHGVAMEMVPALMASGVRVIDLGADFRIQDIAVWEAWYGQQHTAADWVARAVYGLPETRRKAIVEARLVACPGCYPTAIQLGFKPLLEAGLVDCGRLIADAKSGVSGAGRKAAVGSLLCEASESFKAYGVAGHRHQPEIEQELVALAGGPVGLTFVPHLTPMIRGIHATLYAELNVASVDLQALYESRYAGEPFVDVLPAGSHPETRSVKGSNLCRIAVYQKANRVIVLSVIDNLVKGAAGQAVQCMNIMFGQPEDAGLGHVALVP